MCVYTLNCVCVYTCHLVGLTLLLCGGVCEPCEWSIALSFEGVIAYSPRVTESRPLSTSSVSMANHLLRYRIALPIRSLFVLVEEVWEGGIEFCLTSLPGSSSSDPDGVLVLP